MKNRIKLLSLFLGVIIGIVSIQKSQAQGLRFYGNKAPVEQRTSYLIFNKTHTPEFDEFLNISFELKIQDFDSFGYLLHIVNPNGNAAYSFTYTYIDKKMSAFKFNTEGKTNHISMNFNKDSIKGKWIPVQLLIDLSTGDGTLIIAGKKELSKNIIPPSTSIQPQLYFGSREHLLDVPDFAIRQLTVSGGNLSYSFLLNESRGEEVHDITGKVQGKVIFPYWLINDFYHWKKNVSFSSKTSLGSKFNETQQEIQFISQDSLYTYQVDKRALLSNKYANKMPVQMQLGTNFVDELTNRICAYEINNLPEGDTTMAVLDVPTLKWKSVGKAFTPVQLHHHNGFVDKTRNRYLVFGGFGNRRYSNKFLTYNATTDRWDTLQFKGDDISPRFYSSMATSERGDYLYIYGGVGNGLGDQSVGHNYYNDLYRVDLAEQTIKRCWDNCLTENLVPAGHMILSTDERYLYVLRYAEYIKNSHLKLYRISVADGSMEQLGDSIPFVSESIASNIALYYNSSLQEFYCVIQEFFNLNQSAKAIVYTLSAPPVGKVDMDYYALQKNTDTRIAMYLIVSILSFCILLALLFYLRKRQQRKVAVPAVSLSSDSAPLVSPVNSTLNRLPSEERAIPKNEYNKIYVYGIFTVYGKSGRDITHLFSNKLKQIFLYILLNSTKDGVSSPLLNDLFWPDKTEDKVKNLKGVTVSNLRKALSEIEGIELVYEKGFFKIVISEPCYCDYFCMYEHLPADVKSLNYLLSIWERGRLLESSKDCLFDKYKQYSENIIFSSLPQELPEAYLREDYKYVLLICDILLKRDPLFEPALSYSIYSYARLNEFEKLSKAYAMFITEYRNTMGEDYSKSLEMLLQEGKLK